MTCVVCGAPPDASTSLVPRDEAAAILAAVDAQSRPLDFRSPPVVEPGPSHSEQEREIDAESCRRSLAEFCKLAWLVLHPGEPLEWSWHHDALCDHLQWLFEAWLAKKLDPTREMPCLQLAINLPPSSLKTELMMVFAPAWMWLRAPQWRVLCLSCNPRVAMDSAVLSRRVIESAWYQDMFAPAWTLREDQNAKSNFGTSAGGARQSHGMSATIVGEHADCILVDDPSNPKNVSRAELQRVNYDWVNSIQNRVTDERVAIRVIVQQRVDPDDLTGCVLREGGWIIVSLPMEHEPDRTCRTPMPCREPTIGEVAEAATHGSSAGRRYKLNGPVTWGDPRRAAGELMVPRRYPPNVLAKLKRAAGSYGWSSQYQQNPRPMDGSVIKRSSFSWYRIEGRSMGDRPRPPGCVGAADWKGVVPDPHVLKMRGSRVACEWMAMSMDAANEETTDGSLWGLVTACGAGARVFVLDDASRRGDIVKILDLTISRIVEWRPRKLLVEKKAAGPTLVRLLTLKLAEGVRGPDGSLVTCEVELVNIPGDKAARLRAVTPTFEQGLVHLPEGAEWVREYVDELTLFPNAENDDRVDATSQLLAWAMESTGVSALYKLDEAAWQNMMRLA